MATQIVMNRNGDPRHNFDARDAKALLKAERRFKALTGAGFTAATRTAGGEPVVTPRSIRRQSRPCFFRGSLVAKTRFVFVALLQLQTISSGGSSRPAHAGREPFAIGSSPKYSRAPRPQTLEGMAVVRAAGAVRCAQLFRGHRLPHRKAIPDEPRRRSERLRAGRRWPAASGLVLRT